MNNYEKIKSMTIEQMAKEFNLKQCEECSFINDGEHTMWKDCNRECWAHPHNKYYLNWLKQEAE